MGFVAGIDDAPVEGGFQGDFLFDVVGALGDLVAGGFAVLSFPDAAGTADDLAGDEERYERLGEGVEVGGAVVQVVFVAAVAGDFTVHIIFVDFQGWAGVVVVEDGVVTAGECGHSFDGGAENMVAGRIVDQGLVGVGGFGAGVFGVGVVNIKPAPVFQYHVGNVEGVGVDDGDGAVAFQVEATAVPQGVFGGEVPPGALPLAEGHNGVGRGDDGAECGVGGGADAVFGFGAEDHG